MDLKKESDNNKLKKGLYLISTPIGNLADISYRAINILENSDHILCEDTRVSKNLLNKYKIKANLISNHKFNEVKNLEKIMNLLKSDQLISIISDAGTPTISDPGSKIINECIKNNIDVIPVPGASAVSTAVSISGFSERFYFYGFFPEKDKIINEDLSQMSILDSSIVFFISPKKFNKSIKYLKKFFTGRKILICREMTKYYEEFIRNDVDELVEIKDLKGELTIVISEKQLLKNTSQNLSESDIKNIKKMINKLSLKEITEIICTNQNISKKLVYNYCLSLKDEL
ncbi:16S rRNA (cytidine(1402)-2'-O)-methyltransferase [Candidatus Pelagibacter sp.]|uniref:16S rRNA (cytidine(1402)-2'-O)-methyltransferase n=1 Tax=Candidatus Pelagibacter sp. TaxID=2024849 RepID=UPI003F875184